MAVLRGGSLPPLASKMYANAAKTGLWSAQLVWLEASRRDDLSKDVVCGHTRSSEYEEMSVVYSKSNNLLLP